MDDEQKLRHFAELLRVYLQHDEEERAGIARMAAIVADPEADEDESRDALNTMREGLFPTLPADLDELLEQ